MNSKNECDFASLVKSRKTVFEFDEKRGVDQKDINLILECARWSPSSLNSQPWEFILIKDRKAINSITEICHYGFFHTNPSVMIAVVLGPLYIEDKALLSGKLKEFTDSHKYLNIAMPVLTMQYAATALGISSAIMSPVTGKANKLLNVPNEYETVLVVGLGYEKEGAFQKPRERKSLKDILYLEKYGKR